MPRLLARMKSSISRSSAPGEPASSSATASETVRPLRKMVRKAWVSSAMTSRGKPARRRPILLRARTVLDWSTSTKGTTSLPSAVRPRTITRRPMRTN